MKREFKSIQENVVKKVKLDSTDVQEQSFLEEAVSIQDDDQEEDGYSIQDGEDDGYSVQEGGEEEQDSDLDYYNEIKMKKQEKEQFFFREIIYWNYSYN